MMLQTIGFLVLPALILAHPREHLQRHSHSRRHDWGTGAAPSCMTGVFTAIARGLSLKNSTDNACSGVPEFGPLSIPSILQPATSSAESETGQGASTTSVAGGQFFALSSTISLSIAANFPSSISSGGISIANSGTNSASTSNDIPATLRGISATTPSAVSVTTSSEISSDAAIAVSAAEFFQQSSPVNIFSQSASSVPASSIAFGSFASSSAIIAAINVSTPASTSNNAASSAVASSTSVPVSPGASSGKKGLSYNNAALTDVFTNSGMSWAYNWASIAGGSLPSGVSYVPMLWGLAYTSDWSGNAQSAIAGGSTAALSFNEPELSSQSNLDPGTAARMHIQYMNPLSVDVGSPAITNGVGTLPPLGIDWLNDFFAACGGLCDFKQHVTDVVNTAAANGVNKVWLTEFGTTGGDTAAFLAEVMPFLESTPAVEKYAFFMCADPQSLTGTSLNSVGTIYAETV